MEKNRNVGGWIIGIVLIAIGVLSLFGDFFDFLDWDILWPLVVVGVGIAFFIAMLLGGKSLGNLAVPASILVVVGLILLIMNRTNHWEAWSYCWALIICSIGAGRWLHGIWSDQIELRKQGAQTLRTGLILFAVFGVLMQFIFSISGETQWGNLLLWSILLILIGIYLLVSRLLSLGKPEGAKTDLFWPILMIGAGLLACLAYLEWLPKDNLLILLNLWPLLLIVAGVGLLFRGRTPLVGALLGVVVVGIVFVSAFAGGQLGLKAANLWPFDIGTIKIGNYSGEVVAGSGKVISEQRTVAGFDSVLLAIDADLDVQLGETESLTISGEDNILIHLITEVRGGKLVIQYETLFDPRPTRSIQINLTVKDLSALQNTGTGDVKVGSFTTGDFKIILNSSGNIEIENIQAGKITANISSSGNILVKGKAEELDLNISSSGEFRAGDLQVNQAQVGISSSGNATIWVVDGLDVTISSSGNVSYYGSPVTKERLSSSGRLFSKGDK